MRGNQQKWDKRYLAMASEVATWSKDPSSKIGAVIIGTKGQIVSQGYNGFARKINDTEERYNDRETKYKHIIHAESNALLNALYNGASVDGCTLYVTGLPVCHNCANNIIQAGITRVVMDTEPINNWKESGELSLKLFKEAGVEITFIEMNWAKFYMKKVISLLMKEMK